MFQDRCQQIRNKIVELTQRANQLYNITLPNITVRFDLRGRAAGQAYRRGMDYGVRFNRDMMMNQGWDHVFNDTVPHELAHIVGFFTQLDRGHGSFWRRVCQDLGGTGNRCHSQLVTYAKGDTFFYVTTNGHNVAVSATIHRRIQQGTSYTYKNGKGQLNRDCSYSMQAPQPKPVATVAPVKPAQAPVVPQEKQTPRLKTTRAGQPTKAEQVRGKIRELRPQHGEGALEMVVAWAIEHLGMTRQLARHYVKVSWERV